MNSASSPPPGLDQHVLEVLLRITEDLTEQHPLEESLQAVTDAALELVPANHTSLRLLDSSHSMLLIGARSGAGATLPPMTFAMGEGLLGWVVAAKEGVCVEEATKDPRFKRDARASMSSLSVSGMIAEPLWSGGNVIGVLSASSSTPCAFSSTHRLLLRLLANCSAPPIERARLRRLAMTDDLTLAYNQRYLVPRLQEMERARRHSGKLSILLLDLDFFKRVNDSYGHAVGDQVLRQFADRVRATVRRVDVLIRRGGEEFVLIMPQTNEDAAKFSAERILSSVGEIDFELGEGLSVKQTVSIGIATWNGTESADALQQRADIAMYRAKERGRNRIDVAAAMEARRPSIPSQ